MQDKLQIKMINQLKNTLIDVIPWRSVWMVQTYAPATGHLKRLLFPG